MCNQPTSNFASRPHGPADHESPVSIPRLPTTSLRVTSLMLRPSLGAAWLAWQIGTPVGFCAEPLAVAGLPSQRAAPPAWRPRRPSLQAFRTRLKFRQAHTTRVFRFSRISADRRAWPYVERLVDGRRGRAAPRIHRKERAAGIESRRVKRVGCHITWESCHMTRICEAG